MSELELFENEGPGRTDAAESDRVDAAVDKGAPLAARMRPRTLDEIRGQEELLGKGKPLRTLLDGGDPGSMILWGPPGCGKTTLARLFADSADATFVGFSAVTEGVARVREIIKEARVRKQTSGRRTILFCDEIHRFNKAQQDAFLPHVEDGTVMLVGATTENPSFEVVRPLLSRAPVFVLNALTAEDLEVVLREALADEERGMGGMGVQAEPDAIRFIAEGADGDARRALGVLETAVRLVGPDGSLSSEVAKQALQHRFSVYDKSGEGHYDIVSALHKSVRGSDPDAALYWLARMIDGGEDPRYIARRLIRMASEDIGLADPQAIVVAMACRDAYQFLGSPEGELALAEATLYLATAPKSNRAYRAWAAAQSAARSTPAAPVPLHLRNAPTELMKDLDYGKGYRYDPDEAEGVSDQDYFPESVRDRAFYEPSRFGHEGTIGKRLAWWAERRNAGVAANEPEGGTTPE